MEFSQDWYAVNYGVQMSYREMLFGPWTDDDEKEDWF